MLRPPWKESQLLLLLILVASLAARLPTVRAECPIISEWNVGPCLKQNFAVDPQSCNFEMAIYEDCPIGEQIFKIEGASNTLGGGASCSSVFQLEGTAFSLKNKLDAESAGSLQCVNFIESSDGSSSMSVVATVVDVNEFPPTVIGYEGGVVTVNTPENNEPGEVLLSFGVSDPDIGETATLTVTADFPGSPPLFEVKKLSCSKDQCDYNFLVAAALDYETLMFYSLKMTFESQDDRGTASSTSLTVQVFVEDVADEPPFWTLLAPNVELEEEQQPGTEVFTVEAQDRDIVINNDIKYSITDGNDAGLFVIDPDSGVVSTTTVIDREALDTTFFSIIIQALEWKDGAEAPAPNSVTQVTNVLISDLNDNSPSFAGSQQPLELSMDELTTASTLLTELTLEDMDQGAAGQYNIITSDPRLLVNPVFAAGLATVSLTATYDAEDNIFDIETAGADNPLTFTVTATEVDDPSHIGTIDVIISLKDVNDNEPVFDESDEAGYKASIAENAQEGVEVITVQATDQDVSPEFGTASIRYYLPNCDSNNFEVDPETGVVTVSASTSLDFETKPTLLCTVEARDREGATGSLTKSIPLTVTLLDINDTPPQLVAQPSAEVAENSPADTVVMSITASDADTEASLSVDILFPDGTDDAVTGWFTMVEVDCAAGEGYCGELRVLAPPDRETMAELQLTLRVTDASTVEGERIDTAAVTITILDENDVTPEFCEDCLKGLEVYENSFAETVIALVTATDLDEADQGTLLFTCSDNSQVTINATGWLMVKDGADIDRETENTITVTITVTDTADPPHFKDEEVTITVLDRNDNPPVVDATTCTTIYEVPEDAPHGTSVTFLTATDADIEEHAQLSYYLINHQMISGNQYNIYTPFAIDEFTGEITVYENETSDIKLDREFQDSWTLYLRVYDDCAPLELPACSRQLGECALVVKVTDVNDNPPGLPDPPEVRAGEQLRPGDAVLEPVILATDADQANTTATEIHYEVLGMTQGEETELGVAPFVAVDNNGINSIGYMEYWCTLSVTESLEHRYGHYLLVVKATDGTVDEPGLSSTFSVPLFITDYNDHAPQIVMGDCLEDRFITITEESYTGGDSIPCFDMGPDATVSYIDMDVDSSNTEAIIEIIYDNSTMVPESSWPGQLSNFILESRGGKTYRLELIAGAPNISIEEGQAYNLSIKATDKGDEPLSTYDWIYVDIQPVSEFDPAFCLPDALQECVDTTYVTEEDPNDEGSFRVATDEDNVGEVLYDDIYYYIVGGDKEYFSLRDSSSTVLKPLSKLDRDDGPDNYTLLIRATNGPNYPGDVQGSEPTSTDMIQVVVVLMDINDNSPVFESSVLYGSVLFSGSVDQEALILQASDKDLNETLTYEFLDDCQWNPPASYGDDVFEIVNDGTIGTVLVKKQPNILEGYCLTAVTVSDKDPSGEHQANVTVQIFIVESDDQIPFYFENDSETLQKNEESITIILSSAFGYLAAIDSMRSTSGTDNRTLDSVVAVHFVDSTVALRATEAPGSLVAKSVITSAASSGLLSSSLQSQLGELGLSLYRIGDREVEETDDLASQLLLFQILLAVVAMLLGSMVFILLVTYIIRTRKLERRVKVLSTNTFGSQASELNRTGVDAVPNSNMFRGEGANPMWNTSAKDFGRPGSGSLSSGDSVLVGVEDNPEFRDYKGAPKRGSQPEGSEGKSYVGAGGMTSSNPLFGGIEMTAMTDGKKSVGGSSTAGSDNSGDLGVANSNFSFL